MYFTGGAAVDDGQASPWTLITSGYWELIKWHVDTAQLCVIYPGRGVNNVTNYGSVIFQTECTYNDIMQIGAGGKGAGSAEGRIL